MRYFRMGLSIISLLLMISICEIPAVHAFADKDVKAEAPGEKVFLTDVPYFNQNEKGNSQWCVVYSTAMLLGFYGISDRPSRIARWMGMNTRRTPYFSLKSLLKGTGSVQDYLYHIHNLSTSTKIFVTLNDERIDWMKQQLRDRRPILAMYNRINGHAIVFVGYDETYLYVNDPSGAMFRRASETLGRDLKPTVWMTEDPVSPFAGAGIRWDDYRRFINEINLLGIFIVVKGEAPPPESVNPFDPAGNTVEVSPEAEELLRTDPSVSDPSLLHLREIFE